MNALPEQDASLKAFWGEFDQNFLTEENIVAKIRAAALLQQMSPHHAGSENYFQRVVESLRQLPADHRTGALLVFSNVLYLPKPLMEDAWRYLWNSFATMSKVPDPSELARNCHFFEVDPSGMATNFVHLNAIQRRLDTDLYARVPDIDRLFDFLLNLTHAEKTVQRQAELGLAKVLEKEYWVILVDWSLSGQSLVNDLRRYVEILNLVRAAGRKVPRPVILAQVITAESKQLVEQCIFPLFRQFDLLYAVLCDESWKLNSENTGLLMTKRGREAVAATCNWFAENVLDPDPDFQRMRERSEDNLCYGYKACGLTVVEQSNCPTNSVPLLWYDWKASRSAYHYTGPFPRTHSRLGDQKREMTASKWSMLTDEKFKEIVIQAIRGKGSADA